MSTSPEIAVKNGGGNGLRIGYAALGALISVIGVLVMLGSGLLSSGATHGAEQQRLGVVEKRVDDGEKKAEAIMSDGLKTRERVSVVENRLEHIDGSLGRLEDKIDKLLRAGSK